MSIDTVSLTPAERAVLCVLIEDELERQRLVPTFRTLLLRIQNKLEVRP